MAEIRIGTSGYSFADWRGPFYPAELSTGNMLSFYASRFDCAEINATYYHIPARKTFSAMAARTPDGFDFLVKVHADATHDRRDPAPSMIALGEAVAPLAEASKLAGFLAQFPFSFRNEQASRRYLALLADLTPSPFPLFVEFRHSSWMEPALYPFLRNHGIGYVNVDEPPLLDLIPPQALCTTTTGYVRFHGRNTDAWWGGGTDRYDYLYSSLELEEWAGRIRGFPEDVSKIYLFFNNCYHGQAPRNALEMRKILRPS